MVLRALRSCRSRVVVRMVDSSVLKAGRAESAGAEYSASDVMTFESLGSLARSPGRCHHGPHTPPRFTEGRDMRAHRSFGAISLLIAILALGTVRPADANPEGTMTWGVHITLASRWLDPAETEGIITPFMVLYGLHDALVKPMPAG